MEKRIIIRKQLELEFPGRFINCAGQFSIDQSAKIIESAMMVITPDTGMMHITAALKKPMHVFWEIPFLNSACLRITEQNQEYTATMKY